MPGHSNKPVLKLIAAVILMIIIAAAAGALSSCREYDDKFDVSYYFKTDPEKAVLDFIYAISNHDSVYIYDNLILNKDKKKLSREKYLRELTEIISDVENIEIKRIVYLGFENDMSKVVVEFDVKYKNKETSHYKKYIYLMKENNRWKIVFDKTFI